MLYDGLYYYIIKIENTQKKKAYVTVIQVTFNCKCYYNISKGIVTFNLTRF